MASVKKRVWTTAGGETREAFAVRYRRDGKQHFEQFERKGDANDRRLEIENEMKAGTHVPHSTAQTLREACEAWIKRGEAEGLESSTMRQRRLHVDHVLALLPGETKLSKITVARLESARDDLLLKLSRPMARKIVVSLRSIIRQAKAMHLLAAEVGIKMNGRHKRKLKVGVDIPTAPEVKALIEATADDSKAQALICLAAFAGLRASEIRGLRWAHLELGDKPMVTIEERADELGEIGAPKSGAAHRKISLNATTAAALRAWKLAQPPIVTKDDDGQEIKRPRALVFGTASDRPDGLANIRRRVLEPAMVRAGLADPVLVDGKPVRDKDGKAVMAPRYTGLHCLRHFAISSWLRTCAGDLKAVQERAGHATLALTMDTYGHLLDKDRESDQIAAAEKLVLG